MKLRLVAYVSALLGFTTFLYQTPNPKIFFHLQSFFLIVLMPMIIIYVKHGRDVIRLNQLKSEHRTEIFTDWMKTVFHMFLIATVYAVVIFCSGSMSLTSVGQPLSVVLMSLFYALILKIFLVEPLRHSKTN